MIRLKNKDEVEAIRQGGKILAKVLKKVAAMVKPGVSSVALEKVAEADILAAGGRPAFKNYPMGGGIFFPSTLCISINDEVVHGAAYPERFFQAGDIVDLDIGMEWPVDPELRKKLNLPTNKYSKHGGFFTDTCVTVPVAKVTKELKKLLTVTRDCLYAGIKAARPGNYMNDIAKAIESLAERHGYGVVRDFVGHGLGHFAHEEPDVYHFTISPKSTENFLIKEGMVIAIEPMINLGDYQVEIAENGYTALSADGSPSAHFEHTVYISKDGPEIMT